MKKKLILLLFCGLPIFSLANDTPKTTKSDSSSIKVNSLVVAENNVEEEPSMDCVWTSCTGTVCDKKFKDVAVAIDFIDNNDHCN